MVNTMKALASTIALCVAVSKAASASSNSSSYCVPSAVTPEEQSAIFASYVQQFYVVRNITAAFHLYTVEDYIQHNPFEPPFGAAGSEKFLTALFSNESLGVEILHQGFTNGVGWVHWRFDNYDPLPVAIVDIFEFTDSCIKEHWDVTQELPGNATNPIALF